MNARASRSAGGAVQTAWAWLRRTGVQHVPRRLLLLALRAYRLFLSPWLGSACRFEPTCSVYAMGAIERHGAAAGSVLTARRLLRCHPACAGGCDPVPDHPPRLFAALAGRSPDPAPSRKTQA